MQVGASGLVGRLALSRLLEQNAITQVVAPTRRPLEIAHPRLINPVIDFEALPLQADWWAVDAVVCTLGTTLADAGSQAGFRHVDFDYPLQIAQQAQAHGAHTFVLNSAMGANAASRIFYNRVKGELEDALAALGFASLVLVRPGLIDGERHQPRPGEGRALAVSRALRPLLPKLLRPSRAPRIADVLVESVVHPPAGRTVIAANRLA